MKRRFAVGMPTTLWIAIGALFLGYVLGQAGSFVPAGAAGARQGADPATPTELVCTPAPIATSTPVPSPTATATPVPPKAAGQPVPYGDDWTVTVNALSLTPTIGSNTAEGIYALVSLTIRNDALRERSFQLAELRLQDASGRVFGPSSAFTGTYWTQRYAPGIPADAVIAFDVAADTGERFILESTADPTFRVEVMLTRLG